MITDKHDIVRQGILQFLEDYDGEFPVQRERSIQTEHGLFVFGFRLLSDDLVDWAYLYWPRECDEKDSLLTSSGRLA